MLTINLLPNRHVKDETGPTFIVPHRKWVKRIGLALGGLSLLPLVIAPIRDRQLVGLTAKIETLSPKQAAVVQMQRLLDRLREQEVAFASLSHEVNYWSKRLNTLSDIAPDGIWFTEFHLKPGRNGSTIRELRIQGSAVGEGGAEMMRVGRLVQDLKADEGFGMVLRDIQIESIKRVQEREVEVVKFTLACVLGTRTTP